MEFQPLEILGDILYHNNGLTEKFFDFLVI